MSEDSQELIFEELTGAIRQTAFEAHQYFGHGFLEKVYENALCHRLRKKGFSVEQQVALTVRDEDGTVVGDYNADLVVNNTILLEIKAASSLKPEHTAQVINYLKVTGMKVGLLLNFGKSRFRCKRYVR